MKFTIAREVLLNPLQSIAGIVEKRHTMAVLANVLVVIKDNNQLSLTGMGGQVEIVARLAVDASVPGEITVPAKKLLDICRSLPDDSIIDCQLDEKSRFVIKSGRSRFVLSTLPVTDYPATEMDQSHFRFRIQQHLMKSLIDYTAFAMAQQDVRFYLNGMLLELFDNRLRSVTTDGHRLAMCTKMLVDVHVPEKQQVILPRKAVVELSRLLGDDDSFVDIVLSSQYFRMITPEFTFTTKLVDGKFPDYERVFPERGTNIMVGHRESLRDAFARAAILSNEKYRGIRLNFSTNMISMMANNPEQEQAEEQVSVEYNGEPIEVGFNVSYLSDVTNVLKTENVKITLVDSDHSVLIEEPQNSEAVYVVMPMKL